MEAQVKDKEEKLATEKASISELKAKLDNADSRRQATESRVRELKAKLKTAHVAANRTVEEYKKSKNFKEVPKGCIDSLYLRFLECKKKIVQIYPGLDLKDVIESDNKDEEGEEGSERTTEVKVEAKVAIEVRVKQASPREIVSKLITKEETTMEEALTKAIACTEAMVIEVAKGYYVVQINTLKEQLSISFFYFFPLVFKFRSNFMMASEY